MSFPRYKQYKGSGVEWLGEVPEHWKLGKLHHIAILNPAKAELGDIDPQTTISFLPMEAFDTKGDPSLSLERTIGQVETGYTYFRDGDVAFAKVTPCFENGKRAIFSKLTNGVGFGTTELIVLRARHRQTIPKFLYWFVATSEFLGLGEGSMYGAGGLKRVPESFVHQFPVWVPSTDEQNSIVAFLDQEMAKIDALIEEQRRLIELLKEKRQAVISNAITKGLISNIPMKSSGADWLGTVPSHWKVERAGHLFIERDERSESGNEEMLTVSHLTGVTPRSEKTVNMFEAETTEGYKRVYPGDLVINTLWAWMGAMGVSSYSGIVSPAYHVYRARPTMQPDYVNALVRIAAFAKETSRWSKGVWSSRLRLYPQEMFQILFPVPPLQEQRRISESIREQDAKMAELIQESELGIKLLLERRTALISAAVTGKIDVRARIAKPVLSATRYSSGFAHQLLAAEILDRCNSQRMGRIKLQKLIHLCEYHGQVSEVQGDYSRKAAGPFDARAMAGISKNLKKQKWFEEVKEGERYVYRPLEKRGEHKKYLAHWQDEMPRIDEVLSSLGNLRTRECEIISTLYAAWNDLLIDGGPTDDAAILHEASSAEHWHKSKEQIAPERWSKALQWMKDKGLVPVGYGKHTRNNPDTINAHSRGSE